MFEKLPLKVMKAVIKHYNLESKIRMSKMIDGKRKLLTKDELAKELHKHLFITEDGTIRYIEKDLNFPKVKFDDEKKQKKAVKISKKKQLKKKYLHNQK